MDKTYIYGSTGNQYIDSRIEWSSTATTSTNSSKVTATLQYKRNNTGFTTYGTGSFSITINGSKTSVSKYMTITEDAWVTAVSATVTVNHNSDGSKSITISGSGSMPDTSLTSTSCSGTAKLDTIPRASTITSSSSVTLGNKCSVKWTPMSKSFRYKLKFVLGDWSYTTGAIHPNTTSAYTYTGYTIPLEVANQITSAKTGTMTVTLYTYSDSNASTGVGDTSSKTFTVTVPSSTDTLPTVAMTLTAVNSLSSTFSGLYIQGKSKVEANFSGSSAKYNASISSYSMAVSGLNTYSNSPYQSDFLSKTGTITVKGTAIDSRGYSSSVSKSISVISYSKPSVIPYTGEKGIICQRCTSEGTLSPSGTYLRIKAGRKYSKVSASGTQKNFCLLRFRYKTESATSFSSWSTLLAKTNTTTNMVDAVIGNAVSSTTTSYIVQIGVIDDVGESATMEFNIPTDQVTFHLKKGGKGAAFGKYAELDNTLELAWDIDINGNKIHGLPSPNNESDESEAVPWGSVRARLATVLDDSHFHLSLCRIGNVVICVISPRSDTTLYEHTVTIPEGFKPSNALNFYPTFIASNHTLTITSQVTGKLYFGDAYGFKPNQAASTIYWCTQDN